MAIGLTGSMPTLAAEDVAFSWIEVDDFESISTGSINGKNGWSADSQIVVENSPVGSGKVLKLTGLDNYAAKSLPSTLANNQTGTLYFRMLRSGSADAFSGLSDVSSPTDFSHFETQVGAQSTSTNSFVARNGSSFSSLSGNFDSNTWFCVWVEANNSSDTYRVYVEGGAYSSRTQIGSSTLNFRNGTSSSLESFFARTGVDTGQLYIDDIYIDSSGLNSGKPSGSCPQSNDPEPPDEPTSGWQKVDDFESISNGGVNNKNGWSADSQIIVENNPSGNGKVLKLSGQDKYATKSLPESLSNSRTGTLYLRMRRSGSADVFSGLSDVGSPNTFSHFETQFGAQSTSTGEFVARNGSSFTSLASTFDSDTWYCVWLEANNSADTFRVFVQGGDYSGRSQIGSSNLSFRNGTSSALGSFLARTGVSGGQMYIDDIYVDVSGTNSGKPSGDCPKVDEPDQPDDPTVGWQEVDNFEGVSTGSVNNKNGWSANSQIVVENNPSGGGKVLKLSGQDNYAAKTLPEDILNNQTGTLYFRMRRSGSADAFSGLSDVASPSEFDHFETQFGTQSTAPNNFIARDGDNFSTQYDGFDADTWYCIWLEANNSSDTFRIFIQGGDFDSRSQIGGTFLDFRNGTSSPLGAFFARTGVDSGQLYIDDIYVDVSGSNASKPSGDCPKVEEPEPPSGWFKVDDFDQLSNGSIGGKNGWSGDSSVQVVADPSDSSEKVLRVTGSDNKASKAFPHPIYDISDPSSAYRGTIFFRMKRVGAVDAFAGASSSQNPSSFDDFIVQFGAQNSPADSIVARDGDQFTNINGAFEENTWYCVWLNAINEQDYTYLALQGGQFENVTPLWNPNEMYGPYDFRTGHATEDLNTFFLRSGSNTGEFYIDDIYVDPNVTGSDQNYSNPGVNCPAADEPDPPDEPTTGWQKLDDFESLSDGSINNKNGWSADSQIVVENDPAGNGKTLKLSGQDNYAAKSLPEALDNNQSGTLYFRMRRSGLADAFSGLSDVSSPAIFDHFETQLGAQSAAAGSFVARNGSNFSTLINNFDANTWYCVWLETDNSANKYTVYVQGGDFGNRSQIGSGINFRNGTSNPLGTFFARTGVDGGQLYIDDIYVDVSGTNPSKPSGNCPAVDEPDPPASVWQKIDDFEALADGQLDNQNGWTATNDIMVKSSDDNKYISVEGSEDFATKSLPEAIPQNGSGTIFFRAWKSGAPDVFAGLSGDSNPTEFEDFETQFGAQSTDSDAFKARNGNSFVTKDQAFSNDYTYCVWMFIDNQTQTYDIRVEGAELNPLYDSYFRDMFS
ncbi:MAG: hypothetical protein AAGD96_17755, partial [Chloroflexota bacterium]